MDLYRRENRINYTFSDQIEKRYFIVPLRLTEQALDPSHYTNGQRSVLTYRIDQKLLEKTERLYKQGFKNCQDNVPDWLRKKNLLHSNAEDQRKALLEKWMFVKEDKPNSCYHFDLFL